MFWSLDLPLYCCCFYRDWCRFCWLFYPQCSASLCCPFLYSLFFFLIFSLDLLLDYFWGVILFSSMGTCYLVLCWLLFTCTFCWDTFFTQILQVSFTVINNFLNLICSIVSGTALGLLKLCLVVTCKVVAGDLRFNLRSVWTPLM